MRTSYTLRNSICGSLIVMASLACNVERRPLDSGGIGTLPDPDSGAKETDTKETTSNHAPDSGTESVSTDDAGTTGEVSVTLEDAQVGADAATVDAEVDSDAAVDAAADAAPDAGEATEEIIESAVRGWLVVESDYSSINVSVWGLTGNLLSSSLVSSSSEDPGLSAPFSHDVVVPSQQQAGDEAVFIDRANGVLTWVSLETGTVERQLDVKVTDFYADPYDYVAYDEDTAFVPRYGINETGGVVDYDRGSDVLVINPSTLEVTGSIDLVPAMEGDPHPPRPSRAVLAGGLLRVLLEGWDSEAGTFAPARLATIDPETLTLTNVLVLDDVQNCTNLAVSPTGTSVVLGCTGPWSSPDSLPRSGIVHVSAEAVPEVLRSVPASALGNEQINSVAFTGPSTVAYVTFGRNDADTYELLAPDTLRVLDLKTGEADEAAVFTSDTSFVLGSVRCSVVGQRCIVADASTNGGVLRQLTIREDGRLDDVTPNAEEAEAHVMPPRYLGAF